MARAAEVAALRGLGLGLAAIARVLGGDAGALEPALAAHQAALEARGRELAGTVQNAHTAVMRRTEPVRGSAHVPALRFHPGRGRTDKGLYPVQSRPQHSVRPGTSAHDHSPVAHGVGPNPALPFEGHDARGSVDRKAQRPSATDRRAHLAVVHKIAPPGRHQSHPDRIAALQLGLLGRNGLWNARRDARGRLPTGRSMRRGGDDQRRHSQAQTCGTSGRGAAERHQGASMERQSGHYVSTTPPARLFEAPPTCLRQSRHQTAAGARCPLSRQRRFRRPRVLPPM